jgi:hypothetical protein
MKVWLIQSLHLIVNRYGLDIAMSGHCSSIRDDGNDCKTLHIADIKETNVFGVNENDDFSNLDLNPK